MPTIRRGMTRVNTQGFRGYSAGIQAHKRQRRIRRRDATQAATPATPTLRQLAHAVWDAACDWARRAYTRASRALGR